MIDERSSLEQGTGNRDQGKGKEPPKAPTAAASPLDGFSDFWSEYPNKVGKGKARDAWRKHKCGRLTEEILGAISEARKSKGWLKDSGQFIPNPATWLNQSRWEDTPAPAETPRVEFISPFRDLATIENQRLKFIQLFEQDVADGVGGAEEMLADARKAEAERAAAQ